jgi:hypothetical protein
MLSFLFLKIFFFFGNICKINKFSESQINKLIFNVKLLNFLSIQTKILIKHIFLIYFIFINFLNTNFNVIFKQKTQIKCSFLPKKVINYIFLPSGRNNVDNVCKSIKHKKNKL